MKDEATPEQLAMARRVINENSNYMQGLDRGQCNFSAQEVMQITLASIIETTELATAYVQNWDSDCDELAYDLRSGDHLKDQDHG